MSHHVKLAEITRKYFYFIHKMNVFCITQTEIRMVSVSMFYLITKSAVHYVNTNRTQVAPL